MAFPWRRGEWPFVAGLAVAAGLFVAAHIAAASTDRVDGALRLDSGKESQRGLANARVDEVTGASKVVVVGSRRYSLVASSHAPRAGENWQVAVTATDGGRPMKATIRADALLNGSTVRHIATTPLRQGVYATHFPWPNNAVGLPLALRFTIDDGTPSESLVYAVRVRPARG
jgi:hypothetical protein